MTRPATGVLILSCFAAVGLLAGPPARGAEPAPATEAVAPFVNDQTIAVIAIDLASPGAASTVLSVLRAVAYREPDRAENPTGIRKALSYLIPGSDRGASETNVRPRDGVGEIYLVVIWSDTLGFASDPRQDGKAAFEDSLFLVVPQTTKEVIAGLGALLPEPGKNQWNQVWACREINSAAVMADARLLDRLSALKAAPRPEFATALAAAGRSPLRIAVAAPPLFARAAREILTSPAPGTSQPLGDCVAQIQWIGIGVNAAAGLPNLQLQMALAPLSDKQSMLKFFQQTSQTLAEMLTKALRQAPVDQAAAIELPPATLEGERIAWALSGSAAAQFAPLVKHLADDATAAAEVETDGNHLKAIGIAFHRYHDAQKRFPDVAIRDSQGHPLLSWRVAILPYFGQQKLYDRFHRDEPWDSPHNRQLIDEIPAELRTARTAAGRTRFLGPVGEKLAFTPQAGELNVKSFPDGTSQTIRLVEVDPDHAVIWTAPEDLIVDLENPTQGITDGTVPFLTGFADASVHAFKGSIRPAALRAFLTRNGGEPSPRNNLYPAP